MSTLPEILEAMVVAHERMLELAAAQRAALAVADADAFSRLAAEHVQVAAAAADLDRQRRALLVSPSRAGETASHAVTLHEAIADLPEGVRVRTLGLVARLKECLLRLRHEQAVVRTAAASMLGHLDGLARHVARALGHAGTYNQRGSVPHAPVIASAIDLKF